MATQPTNSGNGIQNTIKGIQQALNQIAQSAQKVFKQIGGYSKQLSDLQALNQDRVSKKAVKADLEKIRSSKKSADQRRKIELEYFKRLQKKYKENGKKYKEMQKEIDRLNAESAKKPSFLSGLKEGLSGGKGFGKLLGRINLLAVATKIFQKAQDLLRQALVGSFKAAVDFEAQLAQLQAVTGINNEQLSKLEKNVLDVAGSTKFTSEEIVQLQTELGKLGFSVAEIESATLAVARTAQALGEKVGPVAQRIGQILNQFNLDAAETVRVSDSLVSVINSSALSFEGFSTALQYIGPLGAEVGTTFEETAVAMALLADNGFTASRIGTGLRGIMTELSKTGKDLYTTIEDLADSNLTLSEAVDLVGKRNAAQLITLVDAARRQREVGNTLEDLNNQYYNQGSAAIAAAQQVDTFQGNLDLLRSAVNRVQIAFGNFLKTSKLLRFALKLIDEDGYNAAIAAQAIADADPKAFSQGLQEASEVVGSLKQQLDDPNLYDLLQPKIKLSVDEQAVAIVEKALVGAKEEQLEQLKTQRQILIDRLEAEKLIAAANLQRARNDSDFLEQSGKSVTQFYNDYVTAREKASGSQKEWIEFNRQIKALETEIADRREEGFEAEIEYVKTLIEEGSLTVALENTRNEIVAERAGVLKSLRNERDNDINDLKAAVEFNKKVDAQATAIDKKINGLLAEQNKRKNEGNEIVGEELLLFNAKLEQYKEEKNSIANLTVTLEERNQLAQKEFELEFKRLSNVIKSRKEELANKQALLDIEIQTQQNLANNARTEEDRIAASAELDRLTQQRLQNEIDAFNDLDKVANEFGSTLEDLKVLFEEAGLDGSLIEKAQERLDSFRLGFQDLNLDLGDIKKSAESLADSLQDAFSVKLKSGAELDEADLEKVKEQIRSMLRRLLPALEILYPDVFEAIYQKTEDLVMSQLIPDPKKGEKERQKRIKRLLRTVTKELADAAKEYNDTALENTKNRLNAELEAIRNRYKTEEEILKSQLDNQLITESQFRTKKEELRKKELQEQNQINKAIFDAEKKADLNNVAIEAFEAIASNLIQNYGTSPTPEATLQSALGYAAIVAGAAAKADAIRRRQFFPVQFEEGGFVTGPSHAEGGVPFTVQGQGGYEMEGGEFIVNKKAAAFHRSLLERINGSYKPNTVIEPLQFAQGGLVQGERVSSVNINSQSAESVNYLRAIAEATTTSAIQGSKPVRAYVTERDLRTSATERKLKDRNTTI